MQDADYLREKAYPLTPAQRTELKQLRRLQPLAFTRLRALYYKRAKRDRELAAMFYEVYVDQWERRHLRCLLCRMSWYWPTTQLFRDAHRQHCQPLAR